VERLIRAARAIGIAVPARPGRLVPYILLAVLGLGLVAYPAVPVLAANLSAASVALSDPEPTAPATSVTYSFTGSNVTSAAINCVQVIIATTATGTTAPTGFDGSSAAVAAGQSTLVNSSSSGWSLAASGAANNIFSYTNSSGVTPSTLTSATFVLTNLTNSTTADTAYYFRLNTYANTNCSSSPVDSAITQFINSNGSTLSLAVDPTLSFTVNGVNSGTGCDGTTTTGTSTSTTIPFGTVTPAANAIVCQDLQAATNATSGYTIYMRYTAKPTSFSSTIPDAPGSNASPAAFPSPGTAAYGYSTDDATLSTTYGAANRFTSPSQKWAAATTSNAEIAYEPAGVTTTDYHIAHQVGIATNTPAGAYSTTIIYTCTPIY
jgi:hypothetical protein